MCVQMQFFCTVFIDESSNYHNGDVLVTAPSTMSSRRKLIWVMPSVLLHIIIYTAINQTSPSLLRRAFELTGSWMTCRFNNSVCVLFANTYLRNKQEWTMSGLTIQFHLVYWPLIRKPYLNVERDEKILRPFSRFAFWEWGKT